jgi:DNA repair exonuclease SbcCD ATPase subunit
MSGTGPKLACHIPSPKLSGVLQEGCKSFSPPCRRLKQAMAARKKAKEEATALEQERDMLCQQLEERSAELEASSEALAQAKEEAGRQQQAAAADAQQHAEEAGRLQGELQELTDR